jgi:hypothetical protein
MANDETAFEYGIPDEHDKECSGAIFATMDWIAITAKMPLNWPWPIGFFLLAHFAWNGSRLPAGYCNIPRR